MSKRISCFVTNRNSENGCQSTNRLMWIDDEEITFNAYEYKPYITSSIIKDFSHYECSLEECITQTVEGLNECTAQWVRVEARMKDWRNAIGVEFFPRPNGGGEIGDDDFVSLQNYSDSNNGWWFSLARNPEEDIAPREEDRLHPRTNIPDFLVEFVGPSEQTLEEEEKWDC